MASSGANVKSVKVMRAGALMNLAGLGSNVINLFLVPLFLRELGASLYGVWITASGVAAIVLVIDLGLGMTIAREVADPHRDSLDMLAAARTIYLALAVGGALVVFIAGYLLRPGLGLTRPEFEQAIWIFGFSGVALLSESLNGYPTAILVGLQRFGTISALGFAATVLRAIGFIALLEIWRPDVRYIVAWQALVSMLFTFVAFRIVTRADTRFVQRVGSPWLALRSHARFALSTQFGAVVGMAMWRGPTILVGLIKGSAQAATLSILQRFPFAIQTVLWRLADPLLPAVREQAEKEGIARLLEAGTRWTLLVALPGVVTLAVVAPGLLAAWLGTSTTAAVSVLILTAAAVLAEGVSHAAEQVLWGAGLARQALIVVLVRSSLTLTLCAALIPNHGVLGAALAILIGIAVGTALALRAAAAYCDTSSLPIVVRVLAGLLPATIAAGASAWLIMAFIPLNRWAQVLAACGAAALSFLAALRLSSRISDEERALANDIARVPVTLGRAARAWIARRK
jgi:O-antigen/teichoic acid export membrane protein